jgi:hypothetical protein
MSCREAPISRHEPPEDILGLADQGRLHYWAIVRYQDIRSISRDPATFCSGAGVQFGDARQVKRIRGLTQPARRGSPGCGRRPAVCSRKAVIQSGSTGERKESLSRSSISG